MGSPRPTSAVNGAVMALLVTVEEDECHVFTEEVTLVLVAEE